MSLNLVIIGIFFTAFILIASLYRNSTLDKLSLLDGEKILFEESSVKVEQGGPARSVIFVNCIVRMTNMRIVIAQKMLLSGKYALRHLILYNRLSDSTDIKTSLSKGCLNITITKSDLKISEEDGACIVSIEIPGSALTQNQFIKYKTSGKEYYMNIV